VTQPVADALGHAVHKRTETTGRSPVRRREHCVSHPSLIETTNRFRCRDRTRRSAQKSLERASADMRPKPLERCGLSLWFDMARSETRLVFSGTDPQR